MLGGGRLVGVKVSQFFDQPAVKNMLTRRQHYVLKRYGAFVRLTARRSMRKKKGPSLAGEPPHAHPEHSGASLRDSKRGGIVYGWDAMRQSAVVGPLRAEGSRAAAQTTPELLEYAGLVHRSDGKTARYPARPYMRPAHGRGLDKLPDFWREARAKF